MKNYHLVDSETSLIQSEASGVTPIGQGWGLLCNLSKGL